MADDITWQSHAEKPGGDHDLAFGWGHPRSGLTLLQQARLLLMRGLIKDHTGAIEGDSDDYVARPSGLLVPIETYWRE